MTDTEHLIVTVKKYPHVWNTTLEEYHNRNLKDASWDSIYADMFEDGGTPEEKAYKIQELKKKWTNIRDYFKKELEKEKAAESGQQVAKRKRYTYLDILSFLRTVYDRKNADAGNSNVAEPDVSQEHAYTHKFHDASLSGAQKPGAAQLPHAHGHPACPAHPADGQGRQPKSRHKADPPDRKPAGPSADGRPREEDSDLNFLKSFLPDMKRMSAIRKVDFKIGMMHLLKDVIVQSSDGREDGRFQGSGASSPLACSDATSPRPVAYFQSPQELLDIQFPPNSNSEHEME